MGTEQQQEFKSEKPRHKSMPKNIPFTDHSIENLKPSIITSFFFEPLYRDRMNP